MKNFSYGLLIILLGVIIPVNSYSQRLIDLYEKLPKSNITLEKQVFDSSGNLRSTFKLKRLVDSLNNLTTEYQDVSNLIHIVKKIYYRKDGQIESIVIDDSCEQEIIKYFYNKDRLDYIIKYSNGIPFEKMKYSYSGEVEKVKYYVFNLTLFCQIRKYSDLLTKRLSGGCFDRM